MKITPMEVTLIDSMGSDLSVVNAARVSFHKESEWKELPDYDTDTTYELFEKDQKLISYLAKHGHWTPFGHAFLSFRIKAPIFVARQLVKHQVGLCWNEVSRRYVDDEPEFWFPTVWRGRPTEGAKQGSSGELARDEQQSATDGAHYLAKEALAIYQIMLDDGVAPEQARMVLPLNCHTEWVWSGSLAAFGRVCKLRLDPHAQAETREIASEIARLICEQTNFQHSWSALLG